MLLKPMLSLSSLRCAGGTPIPSLFTPRRRLESSTPGQWPGLQSWRESSLNENWKWGSNGPEASSSSTNRDDSNPTATIPSSLAEWGTLILSTSDPLTKSRLSHLAYTRYCFHNLPVGISRPPDRPARPPKPPLVSPKEIPAHKDSGLPLNAYMLHNLAHVELNAIDLAWDTVVRFSQFQKDLGDGFFSDFAHVADDESRHFGWCLQRLAELGFNYGDMPAHNLLWRECERSSGSIAARLAVIPLVQEARGLDAGPRLVQKLIGFGDHRTSDIVAKIADEEVAHVAVGVFWFLLVCEKMGRVPCETFKDLLKELNVELKGPFNYSARDIAGIPRDWYDGSSSDKGDMSKLSEATLDSDLVNIIDGFDLRNISQRNPIVSFCEEIIIASMAHLMEGAAELAHFAHQHHGGTIANDLVGTRNFSSCVHSSSDGDDRT